MYCGCALHDDADATVDHINAAAGPTRESDANLRAACRSCNCAKGDRDAEYLRQQVAFRRMSLAAVISLPQYQALQAMGINLPAVPRIEFFFETLGAEGSCETVDRLCAPH